MARRIEYHVGEKIGPHGCTFLSEEKRQNNKRMVMVTCGVAGCDGIIIASLRSIKYDGRYKCDKHTMKSRKYKAGDFIDEAGQFIYIREVSPDAFGHRRVLVYNVEIGKEIISNLSFLVTGKVKYGQEYGYQYRRPSIEKKYINGSIITNPAGESFRLIKRYEDDSADFVRLKDEYSFHANSLYAVVNGACTGESHSQGEKRIENALQALNISYIREKTFPDLVGETGMRLRYDFWLPEKNILIEYDGGQYFYSVPLWGGNEYLKDTQHRDSLKNDYARNNGIRLIRISYKDKNLINDRYLNKILIGKEND